MSTPSVVDPSQLVRVPKRPVARWSANILTALIAACLAATLILNPRFQWGVVARYFTADSVMRGLAVTLQLTVISMLLGSAIGVLLALMRLSKDRWLAAAANTYIWFFRGTPLLVHLIFWFNIAVLYPKITIGVPGYTALFDIDGNDITPFVAALLALSLHEAAYMAEIIRGGILAVGHGQREAALALGMRKYQAFVRITLPQALRVIVPAAGNQTILMLKTTSLVSVIAISDLLYSVQVIYARTFEIVPLLLVACIWYLLMTSVLTVVQNYLERRLGRGYRSEAAKVRTPRPDRQASPADQDGRAKSHDAGLGR